MEYTLEPRKYAVLDKSDFECSPLSLGIFADLVSQVSSMGVDWEQAMKRFHPGRGSLQALSFLFYLRNFELLHY
jgi:hypothetical protein